MKKNKYILGILAVLFAMTSLYSCKDDAPVYEPADKLENDQVFFPSTNSLSVNASSVASTHEVAIARVKTDNAATVPLTLTGGNGLYSIPASVTFNSGQATTTFQISYDPDEVGFDNFNDLVISIGEAYKTPYGITDYAFSIGIPAPWQSLGTGTIVDGFVSAFFGVANVSWEVEIQENDLQPGFFRLVNPYAEGYPYNEPGDWDTTQDYFFEIHAENPDAVYINLQTTGMDWGYGKFIFGSLAGYYMSNGETLDDQIAAGRTGTYKDGIITFPPSTLAAGMADYNDGALRAANGAGSFMVVMPGVVLADYSIDVTYLGRFTDTDEENFAVAEITFGTDVEIAQVAMVEGSDLNAALSGMLDGTIETIELDASGTVQFPVASEGEYSILAISYGGGESQEVAYDTFDIAIDGSDAPVDPTAIVTRKVVNQIKRSSIKTNLVPVH
jgi:hypothetical protein